MGGGVVEEKIQVFVRARPAPVEERSFFTTPGVTGLCVGFDGDEVVVFEGEKRYRFSGVFPETASQQEVYDRCARRVVSLAAQGHNGAILAYGQTGSGKTYTMRGEGEERGLVALALEQVLAASQPGIEMTVSASYVELYCEVLFDLLDPSAKKDLWLRERPVHDGGGVFVEGVARIPIDSVATGLQVLAEGDARRSTAATACNERSSRSHAAFVIHVERSSRGRAARSALTMVDLAGSEKSAGLLPQRFEECKAINLSLAALGNCVAALAQQRPHVPFRDSKLTRLLQGSLGGSAVTSLIATVAPTESRETKATLDFAARASQVEVKARPQELDVDYRALFSESQAKLDASSRLLHELESERANWRREGEKQREESAKLGEECEQLRRRLAIEERRREELAGTTDTIEAIEVVHARWARETQLGEDRAAAQLVACKAHADLRVRAYRTAAETATADCDRAEEELTVERTAHLETLAALRKAKAETRDLDARTAQRVSDLLVELHDTRGARSELEKALEMTHDAAATSADELHRRVAALEIAAEHKTRDLQANYVARERVVEMENLFRHTVEHLATRLSSLEQARIDAVASGNARTNMSAAARDLLRHLEEQQQHHNSAATVVVRRQEQPETACDETVTTGTTTTDNAQFLPGLAAPPRNHHHHHNAAASRGARVVTTTSMPPPPSKLSSSSSSSSWKGDKNAPRRRSTGPVFY
ncbi:hypothetical protein CTAYLR_009500 [Chrysophaeum taylorii]|uniref:Kinesin motor domain-containing protein n=1 Tax=Chrysophaeum taylorii TaxID=2483200 RepID=A0AAD7U4V8_9STRA|nr:hypothetical protein CTAYLR_009500 [Chrysophaeum taylorii]